MGWESAGRGHDGRAPLPRPTVDEEVAHGYRVSSLNALAVTAARGCHRVPGMALEYRAETAWSAMAELLYTATRRPEEPELIAAGWAAIRARYYRDRQTHGYGGKDTTALSPAFCRYWTSSAALRQSHEDEVVDRVAFHQIWAVLSRTHREVLCAVAHHPTRARVAAALGLSNAAFGSRLVRARRAFFALWHEHETPSRMWGADRPNARPERAMFLLRQRGRTARERAVRPARPHRRVGAPRKNLGISGAELLARHEAGQSMADLARALGVSRGPIAARIAEARAARRRLAVRPPESGTGHSPRPPIG